MSSAADFEKLGVFYLGKEFDASIAYRTKSLLTVHYLIGDEHGVRHVEELRELTLFTEQHLLGGCGFHVTHAKTPLGRLCLPQILLIILNVAHDAAHVKHEFAFFIFCEMSLICNAVWVRYRLRSRHESPVE